VQDLSQPAEVSVYCRGNAGAFFVIVAAKPVFATRAFALVLVVGLALAASGCGRAGPLEPPPNPSASPTPQSQASSDTGGLPAAHHKPPPIVAPKTPFVLDPLL
jgi:predicted small lipoprotein YifL